MLFIHNISIHTKRHSLVQISLFFKKTKCTFLKSISFHFKAPNCLVGALKWKEIDFKKVHFLFLENTLICTGL